ncbi:uncharacterized protein LOC127265538 [Andrographis paniculata]|uniref:uncharacterized protein LOC127265538 n=1 Tax=Andrographis paniculata TaxID=175694 RepID=UPI0021E9322E|nr:uncharacterized protein LOC127265538 [Andrographis paniculata]
MAPKRKQPAADGSAVAVARVTRSSTRQAKTTATATATAANTQPNKRKKTTKTTVSPSSEPPEVVDPEVSDASKTIIIEHCKQCNSFKTRAVQVKNGVEKDAPGVKVVVNPEKPRRGCFEIREKGGETFVSLLDMKRPFKPMKDLDMEKLILDIVEKIK